ncbi:3891_t:CDS:2, partial [Scutellospora calospora]
ISFKANSISQRMTSVSSTRISLFEAQQTFIHVTNIIRVQWRAALGAAFMLVVYSTNWALYSYHMPRLDANIIKSDWFQEWMKCLETGTQSTCAFYAHDYVPRFYMIIVILAVNRFCGIVIFILFAGKRIVFVELWNFITKTPRPASSYSISTERRPSVNVSRTPSTRKDKGISFSSFISTSKEIQDVSNNSPLSASLNSNLSTPPSILMSSQEKHLSDSSKFPNSRRLTFSSFTTDNNYLIEPIKHDSSLSYVTIDLIDGQRQEMMEKNNETALTMPQDNNDTLYSSQ